MNIVKLTALTLIIASGVPAMAAAASQGTSKEQAACRPDVRRFCSSIKAGSDDSAFLSCLQSHRSKLSKACLRVLVSHGT